MPPAKPSSTDRSRRPARMLTRVLIALMSALVCSSLAATHAVRPRTAVLVIQQDGPSTTSDQATRDRLVAHGLTVRVVGQSADPAAARDADLVMIAASVSAKEAKPGWRQLPVPLITWENDLLDDLAMSGKRHDVDFGEAGKERYFWIVNAPHLLAGGLPAGVADVYVKRRPMSWGKPGLEAAIIATLYGQPEKAAVFDYEKSATMDYEALAPALRVMLFLGNDGFTDLPPAGLALFDATVDRALTAPPR